MSNPADFIRACGEGKVWLFCGECAAPKNFNQVEHLRTVENPAYWGTEPWWHEVRVFKCPDCGTTQQSTLHLDE
jgi:acetone carboxylase gamma subunit